MDLSDPTDLFEGIRELKSLLDRLHSGAFLENSSVSGGRLRFIAGLLLIDEGGTLQVIGQLKGNGTFEWSGPWKYIGNGEILGDAVVKDGGRIRVEGGESPATIEDGKVSFDTGGELEADVDNGGARLRKDDAVVNVGNVASMRKGDASVVVGPLGITINVPGGQEIRLQGPAVLPSLTLPPPSAELIDLVLDANTNRLHRKA